MEKETLTGIWKKVSNDNLIQIKKNNFQMEINNKVSQLESAINSRNKLEIFVAILIMPFAVYKGLNAPTLISQIGAFLLIPSLLLIIYKLISGQKLKKYDLTKSLNEFLNHSYAVLKQEKQLLGSVIYWYILPGFISLSIYFIGKNSGLVKTALALSILALVNVFVYYLNMRAVKNQIEPVIKRIDQTLKELNSE